MSRYRDFIPAAAQLTGPITTFAPGTAYQTGDLVISSGNLYKALKAKATSAPFNIADWERLDAGGAIVQWEVGHTYAKDRLVVRNGALYSANAVTTPGSWVASEWDSVVKTPITAFDATKAGYSKDDIVVQAGNIYKAKAAIGSAKAFDPTDWDQIDLEGAEPVAIHTFSATPKVAYKKDDLVVQAGIIYKAKGTPTPGAFQVAEWTKIGGGAIDNFDQNTTYVQNDLVVQAGRIYRANGAVTAGSAFDPTDWTEIDASNVNLDLTAYDPTATYKQNDLVFNGGKIYRATATPPTVGPFQGNEWKEIDIGGMPAVSITVFDTTKTYKKDELVSQLGSIYKAKAAVTAKAFDPTEWDRVDAGAIQQSITPYDPTATYALGDIVVQGGNIYKNKTAIASPEAFTATKWDRIDAGAIQQAITPYDQTATYALNDIVVENGMIYRNTTAIAAPEAFTASKWAQIDVGAAGKIAWQVISSAYTAKPGDGLLVDTSGGSVTITLPPSPSLGDEIWFEDAASAFNNNALVVARNTKNIMGLAQDMTVDTQYARFLLVYSDAAKGWRII